MNMAHTKEETFANFTTKQAKEYNASRGAIYPAKLYETIVAYHKKNGGEVNLVVDMGCGPGNATRDLAAYFERVIGLDGSAGMIETAKELTKEHGSEEAKSKVSFRCVPAEKITEAEGIEEGSVDVITVATALHWFDLPAFYESAHKALKPGGTLAAWIPGRPEIRSTAPNATEINAIFQDLRDVLDPYRQTLSHRSDDMYSSLPLPWSLPSPVSGFSESSFQRIVFSDANENQIMPQTRFTVSQAERMFGSGSMTIRWREAHPELAGTEQDVVLSHFKKVRALLGGHEEALDVDTRFGLLLWKKDGAEDV